MEPAASISIQFKALSGYMATSITSLSTISGAVAEGNVLLTSISGQYTALLTNTSGAWKELAD